AQAAKVMGLCVWDHIIIGGGRMVSLREEGFL
ncbi:JAB domain-containing protein, partial [Acetobacter orientalis]